MAVAQSEAGKSVRTVPNDEEEEEFGPQLITKLEVCTESRNFNDKKIPTNNLFIR